MGTIRINELARELEVKSKAILDCLVELGVTEKKSHSSALDEELAERVRARLCAATLVEAAEEPAAGKAPAPPASPHAAAPAEVKHTPEPALGIEKLEFHSVAPLTRSIAEIKAEARRAVMPPPPGRPATVGEPRHVGEKPGEHRAGLPAVGGPAHAGLIPRARDSALQAGAQPVPPMRDRLKPGEAPPASTLRASAVAETPSPAKGAEAPPPRGRGAVRGSKAARLSDPASSQPIYPPAVLPPKSMPGRPIAPRRPGEPRPMHPTSARPFHSVSATGGVQPARPPVPRRIIGPHRVGSAPMIVPARPLVPEQVPITRKITISEGVSVKDLAEKLEVRAKEVIKRLLDRGIFATINQTLDSETAKELGRTFGAEADVLSLEEDLMQDVEETDRAEDLKPRAPVVTVMGHVDHGKTSLLDAVRETNVAGKEAGGITQRIGAYQVETQNRRITFIDTPGHEAFTLMRARGAKATDIVVLVVAADDGVMPQTIEAINHARAAKVPIVVAINKIDKPEAQPDRVKKQLSDHGLMPEAWGGDTVTVEVSAKQRTNLELLLEMILLVADLQGLKASPTRPATGTVLEAKLDRGRGPVATVLVQQGVLRAGETFVVGAAYGKVRAMFDDRGHPSTEALPSTPVEVLGLEDVPQAGDRFQVIEDSIRARQIALYRQSKVREAALAKSSRLTLEHLHEQLAAGDVKELSLVLKADVQGSVEVLSDTLKKLSTERVKVKVIHAGVGAITETDVLLASASNAVIVGFNVRPERKAAELAQLEDVDIRLHTVIYNVTDEIKKAMVGLLSAVYKEVTLGRIEVRDTFHISRVGTVAGCYVQEGKVTREARVRLLRDNVVVYEGRVRSLRRFKDDVPEVKSGTECGVALENFSDVKVGDFLEAFVTERVVEPALA